MNGIHHNGTSRAVRVLMSISAFALSLIALTGCAIIPDNDGNHSLIDEVSDATTDSLMDASSSFMDSWNDREAKSLLEGLASSSGLSKNGSIRVSSDAGERTFGKADAMELLSELSLDQWEPLSSEEFKSQTMGKRSTVGMTVSQDRTIRFGEEQPSGRVDVAAISFWPEERMARYEVVTDDGEGIYLFEDIGITTSELDSLFTSYFRIPATAAKYAEELRNSTTGDN